eukprot:gb/GECG01004727.1/.p1 GENE.gb/GECG01004727.1/~~gb/GECG01004727.1/.p1  ORF type:complete len:148 (+),score=7.63 gb/GECG01004727.1/:1-444(+)
MSGSKPKFKQSDMIITSSAALEMEDILLKQTRTQFLDAGLVPCGGHYRNYSLSCPICERLSRSSCATTLCARDGFRTIACTHDARPSFGCVETWLIPIRTSEEVSGTNVINPSSVVSVDLDQGHVKIKLQNFTLKFTQNFNATSVAE